MQFDEQTEGGIGAGDRSKTVCISLGKGRCVGNAQHLVGVNGRDVITGRELSPVLCVHTTHHSVGRLDAFGLCQGYHLSAFALDDPAKSGGQLLRTAYKTVGSVDIKHIDERVNVSRRMSGNASIHRIHISQDVA